MDGQVQNSVRRVGQTTVGVGSGYEAFQYQDSASGMQLDTAIPLNRIYLDESEFRSAIQQISKCVGSREDAEVWASKLRFLRAGVSNVSDTTGLLEDDTSKVNPYTAPGVNDTPDCEGVMLLENSSDVSAKESSIQANNCELQQLRAFENNQKHLIRTEPSDFEDCKDYIAVSYCWHSLGNAEYHGPTYSIQCESALRTAKCPQALLERVIAYAAKEDMRLIWIDQDCIDQDNDHDKDLGIQAMDIVYERAACSLAVLQACIVEQRHLDALTIVHIDPTGEAISDAELRDLLGALIVIISDPWFKRAWTLQESTSAAGRMTMMVRYDTALYRPECFADCIDGMIEIPMMWMHTLVSANVQLEVGRRTTDCPEDLRAMGEKFMQEWWDVMPADPFDDDEDDNERRFVCNAAEALAYLVRRQNSVPADRLAIMANLCQYKVRLDARALNRLGYGFSVCALTLAALNGDFSMALSAERARNKSDTLVQGAQHTRLPPYGFSWLLPADLCLNDVANTDNMDLIVRLRTDLSQLSRGLQVRGRLWVVDRIINVRPVLEMVASKWMTIFQARTTAQSAQDDVGEHKSHAAEGIDTLEAIIHRIFCASLARYLKSQHFHKMADLLSRNTGPELLVPTDNDLLEVSLDQTTMVDKLRPYIAGQYFVTQENTLALARPLAGTTRAEAYCGVFEGTVKDDLIFTPDIETIHPAPWKHQNERFPTAWRVSIAETGPSQRQSYSCHGLIHGNWLIEHDDDSVQVCFV